MLYFFAGAILNSSILPASAVHPSSETEEIKGRLEVHLKMNEDHEDHNVMTMGLFIKACVHKTCIFKRKVFDETPIPGKKWFGSSEARPYLMTVSKQEKLSVFEFSRFKHETDKFGIFCGHSIFSRLSDLRKNHWHSLMEWTISSRDNFAIFI